MKVESLSYNYAADSIGLSCQISVMSSKRQSAVRPFKVIQGR